MNKHTSKFIHNIDMIKFLKFGVNAAEVEYCYVLLLKSREAND